MHSTYSQMAQEKREKARILPTQHVKMGKWIESVREFSVIVLQLFEKLFQNKMFKVASETMAHAVQHPMPPFQRLFCLFYSKP